MLCSTGENSQEGLDPADEPSQVREDGGHGEHDVPQRGVCVVQSSRSLLLRIHLRQFTAHYPIRLVRKKNIYDLVELCISCNTMRQLFTFQKFIL